MSKTNKSFVIAISGTSGAGKTSLVREVTNSFDDAVSFYFDDYLSTHKVPEDLAGWSRNGSDPQQWKNPRFLADLRLLRSGTPVTPPNSTDPVDPASIIVVEEPFGRDREHMGELIDFVACIELPLEIALARRVLRTLDEARQEKTLIRYLLPFLPTTRAAARLRSYLRWYLNGPGRDIYYSVTQKAKENCDLVLDGKRPVSELAQEVVQHVDRVRARSERP